MIPLYATENKVVVTLLMTPLTSLAAPCVQVEAAGFELERLYGDVTSLCSRIELLPCSSARDRLAQSGERRGRDLDVLLTTIPCPLCEGTVDAFMCSCVTQPGSKFHMICLSTSPLLL